MLDRVGPEKATHRLTTAASSRLVGSRPVVRRVAAKLEVTRRIGPRTARSAARERRALTPLGPAARNAVYRDMWSGSAASLGATYTDLGGGYGEIRRGETWTRVFQQVTVLDDAVTLRRALAHAEVKGQLQSRGLTLAESVTFTPRNPGPALDLIARTGPCVVKPGSGTAGGDGVTVGVSKEDLPLATVVAGHFTDTLVAERWVPGYLFRVLLLDGEVVDIIRDDVPRVVGDGASTVVELIGQENRRREAAAGRLGLSYWEVDLDTALTLTRDGRRATDVPGQGVSVPVKTVTNYRRNEESETYRGVVDPDVLEQAQGAAATVGLRLAGVDVMAPRIDVPLSESGGALLEVNGAPGIHRHYQVRHPERATDVAAVVLGALLA